MSLAPGVRLGPYEIVEPAGKGGMGEVFKATDTRLARTVAIKILPPDWASDPAMRVRFDREAQAIASLNHPHICALHDVGTEGDISYLVMEFLQGETLAARLSRGPLSLDEALDVAVPIANALDQAHRRGVVHRDMKPGNIMLTESGPKLLDFGLARSPAPPKRRSASGSDGAAAAAVPTTPLTVPGLVIGTLQYMAPEQIEGLEADARTDIFAFGAMLHEMITGKRAFEGKTQVLLISSIATSEPPPLSTAEPSTPPALEHVVRTCLAKNPDDRWQTARDLLTELEWIAGGGAAATAIVPAAAQRPRAIRPLSFALAAMAVLALALVVPAYSFFQGPPPPAEIRFRLWPEPFQETFQPDGYFAVSPNGTTLVYRGNERATVDTNGLYITRLGETTVRRLPGTDEATQPFWSPDSGSVAFVVGDRLKKVGVTGDRPEDLALVPGFRGGTWSADGTMLYGSAQGIYRLSAEGGTPELLLKVADQEVGLFWPHWLPDGRRFLYLAWTNDPASRAVMAGSIDSQERTRVLAVASNVQYTAAGHLVFYRAGALFAQRLDPGTLTLSGPPARIGPSVNTSVSQGMAAFSVSRNGVLVFGQGAGAGDAAPEARLWQPTWFSRTGQEIKRVGSPQLYRGIEVSPDGTRVAVHRHDQAGGDIWIVESSGTESRLTFEPARDNSAPVWSPDNQYIVFGAKTGDTWGLFRRLADGRGGEDRLVEAANPVFPMAWAPDGKRIVYGMEMSGENTDLWILTIESAGASPATDAAPELFVSTPFNESHAQISPDGKWIAYSSNDTTVDQPEVYVRPFPAGPGKWQVSRLGGRWPRWHRDATGLSLVFMNPVPDGTFGNLAQMGEMYSSRIIVKGDAFIHEPPVAFLRARALRLPHPGGAYHTFALDKDANVLVFVWSNFAAATLAGAAAPVAPLVDQSVGITIVRHWETAIRK